MSEIAYTVTWLIICNRALSLLGAEPLTTIDESTDRADLCALFLPQVVDTVVQGYDWNCLKKRVELAQSETDPVYEYEYKYALPTDYARAIEIYPRGYKYSIEEDYVLTDMDEEVYMLYIRRPTAEPTSIPGVLINTIVMELATTLCFPLTSNASLQERVEAKSRAARLAAINQDNRAIDADAEANYRGVDYSEERR